MRYYVILNGVNSLTKQGLAINEMPPISKPLMRTQKEEIDGRDGDIITNLGYSAYDKELEIGLYGESYDINDIIAFFNGSGTVVFSDEPDKYYNYQIINQIDYEKLIKFKTATVVFHCQPFKYPLNEVPLEEEFEYVSGSGTNITLDNTAESTFNTFDLKGNTSQEGTPTPDAPINVDVVSGDNTINIVGKNFLPYQEFTTKTMNGITFTNNNDGTYKVNGTATADCSVVVYDTFMPMSGTWRMLGCPSGGSASTYMLSAYVGYWGAGSPNIDTGNGTNITYTGNVKVRFYIKNGTTCNNLIFKPMITTDTSATYNSFEPYKGASYLISLGDIELCKIGKYQDRIYKNGNKWYLEKKIGKVVLNGSENNWSSVSQSGGYNRITFLDYPYLKNFGSSRTTNLLCNNFLANIENNYSRIYQYENDIYFSFPSGMTTKEAFLQLLSTNNSIVYYVLATPTTTEITDTELISQLDALEQANSQSGQTNISQVNSDLPFLLDVVALKLNSDHLIIDNIGNTYAKPTLDLEGTGIVDIYLNDIQMFQVDLSEVNEIVINTAEMEAYNPTTRALANRQVTGDYSNFKLAVGENDLRFSGNLTKATITNYQRWL